MAKIYTKQEIQDLVTCNYIEARKNERCRFTQLEYELNYEINNYNLADELYKRDWTPAPTISFTVTDPVPREIFAPQFRDRIVSHILFNLINPIFEKTFIYDSYSCRKGKGTHFGINRMKHMIRSATNNFKKPVYVLNMDISGYFMNINREILFSLIQDTLEKYRHRISPLGTEYENVIDYDFVYYLIKETVFRDPLKDCIYVGNLKDRQLIPSQKLLKNSPEGTGIIIGDIMSQMYSNIYLNPFDQYVKRELKAKYYGRYVDDSKTIGDLEFLKECRIKESNFLSNVLKLKVHENKTTITKFPDVPITFLGTIILPYRSYIKNEVVSRIRKKLKEGANNNSIQSFIGHLSHSNTYNISCKLNLI